MAEHTPGPWQVIASTGTEVLALADGPDSVVVADTEFFGRTPTERQIADAHLIAAAPDLLAALERMLSVSGSHVTAGNAQCDTCLAVSQAMTAVAKARGEVSRG